LYGKTKQLFKAFKLDMNMCNPQCSMWCFIVTHIIAVSLEVVINMDSV